MSDFRLSKEVGMDSPNMPKINLKHPITEAGYDFCMSAIVRANEVLNAETFEEVYKIVWGVRRHRTRARPHAPAA